MQNRDALTTATNDGKRSLSSSGRAYFEPLVGAPLDSATIRVDDTAERLTQHAHANAATFGHEVFLPPSRFAPDTDTGRGLLAHELTHVTHSAPSPSTLFRDSSDPHYPSRDEQKAIEKLLGRDTEIQPALPGDTSAPKVVDKRKTISAEEAANMASSFVEPLEHYLDTHLSGTGAPLTSEPVTTLPDAKSAMKAAQKAQKAIWAKFGKYLPATPPTLVEQTDTSKPPAKGELAVIYRWKPDEAKTFIRNIASTQCEPCRSNLNELTASSRADVLSALVPLLEADADVWKKVENAARNAVGGRETFGSNAIELTPFSKHPDSDAIHEMLHQLTHPAFTAVFDSPIIEGFTEYFTREVDPTSQGSYDVENVKSIRDAMGGPLPSANLDSPEESLRRAFFQGQLDLLGWRMTESEKTEGDIPSDTPQWDPAKADTELAARNERALAAQDPHRNLIGVGLTFTTSGELLAGRYARVFYSTDPVAHTQLYVEGQVVGTVKGEQHVGASLGLGVDWQTPSRYGGFVLRAQGTNALSGAFDPRIDAELAGKIGLRPWHLVRVGVEAMVFVPVYGDGGVGVGAAVTVELER